jgi:hypothetical protein
VTKLDVSHVLGRSSFDCHLGSPFYLTSETHVVIARLCLLLLTPLALSPQKATPVLTTTLALSVSPQKVTRSICVLRCPRRPVRFAAASCVRSEDHAEFLSKSRPCSRPAGRVRDNERGQSRRRLRRPPHCHRGRDTASDILLGRACLVESPRQGGN